MGGKTRGQVYPSKISMQDAKLKVRFTQARRECSMQNERSGLHKQDVNVGCKIKGQVYPNKISMQVENGRTTLPKQDIDIRFKMNVQVYPRKIGMQDVK